MPTPNERLHDETQQIYQHGTGNDQSSDKSGKDKTVDVSCLDPIEHRLRHIQEQVFRSRGPIGQQITQHYEAVTQIMTELAELCDSKREELTGGVVNPSPKQAAHWCSWIKQARAHPIAELIWDGDIIARLAYNGGCGNRNDARMLDLIYYGPNAAEMSQQPRWTQLLTEINRKVSLILQDAVCPLEALVLLTKLLVVCVDYCFVIVSSLSCSIHAKWQRSEQYGLVEVSTSWRIREK